MACKKDKWADNASGKFYVDEQCIDCDLCRDSSCLFHPKRRRRTLFCFAQPTTEEDKELCMEALQGCPVDAIGCDGDQE